MYYYQVNYLIHSGTTPKTEWYIFDHPSPYPQNKNAMIDYLRKLHGGKAVTIVETPTELTKERFDELKRLLNNKSNFQGR